MELPLFPVADPQTERDGCKMPMKTWSTKVTKRTVYLMLGHM